MDFVLRKGGVGGRVLYNHFVASCRWRLRWSRPRSRAAQNHRHGLQALLQHLRLKQQSSNSSSNSSRKSSNSSSSRQFKPLGTRR
jgi:hypothetical protein